MTAQRNGQPWTAAEDARLCALLTKGMGHAEIAQRLQRPSVQHRIAKLNRAKPRQQPLEPTFVIYRTRCGCTRVEPVPYGWTPEHGTDMMIRLGDGDERRFRWVGERSASGLPIYDEVV